MSQNETRILVVEDEPTIARAVADRLAAEGFGVDVAADGPTAVERARAYEPHLIVLDVMLPGFDGLELMRNHIRKNHSYKKTLIRYLANNQNKTIKYP